MITVNWDAWEQVVGWLSPDAAVLMQKVAESDPGPGVLELGVFKGKLLSLAAGMFEGPVVGVDAMWNGLNNPLTGHDLESATAIVLENVYKVSGGRKAEIIVSDTTTLSAKDLLPYSDGGFGFISVDAGHDPDPVFHDLHLAASLLRPGGIVFLDDAFNSVCPGVAEGFFRFLTVDQRLKAFATGYNKTLLTDASSHELWLSRAYRWVEQGGHPCFERTRVQLDANIAALWKPTISAAEIVPFA